MSINKKLIKLFSKDFETDNFKEFKKTKSFSCPLLLSCKVNFKKEACFTPFFGDEHTRIMLVGEAPSVKKKKGKKNVGSFIGGMLKDIDGKNLSSVRQFIEDNYNTVPYFTDLMKCGAGKQTREEKNKMFDIRTENCFKHYLIKEIKIIRPEKIFCLGWRSYNKLKSAQKNSLISNKIIIIKLLHYGSQASLSLTSEDKLKYIWPLQTGLSSYMKIKLKYINNKIKII